MSTALTPIGLAAARAGEQRAVVLALHFPTHTVFLGEQHRDASWDRPELASTFGGWTRDRGASSLQFHAALLKQDAIVFEADLRPGSSVGVPAFSFTVQLEGLDFGSTFYPEAASCEVAALWPGEAWEDRIVLMDGGRVVRISSEPNAGAVAVWVERDDQAESANIGDETESVSDQFGIMVSHDFNKLKGLMCPIAYGAFQHVPAHRFNYTTSRDYLLICAGPVDITATVEVQNDGSDVSGTWYSANPVKEGAATGDTTNEHGWALVEGNKGSTSSPYNFRWDPDGEPTTNARGTLTVSASGGLVQNGAGVRIFGASMVLEQLLRDSRMTVDWPRMTDVLQRLKGWDIGVYFSNSTNSLEVIRDRLVAGDATAPRGVLPITEQHSGRGVWFAWAEPWTVAPTVHLVEGVDFDIIGKWERDASQVRNSCTLHYHYHHFQKKYLRSVTVGKDQSAACFQSWTLWGDRPLDAAIEANTIWDDGTAFRAAKSAAERMALPSTKFSAVVRVKHATLGPGVVVQITAPSIGLAAKPAAITSASLSLPLEVSFATVERPDHETPTV